VTTEGAPAGGRREHNRDPAAGAEGPEPGREAHFVIGEPFDPRHDICGFYPTDAVDRHPGFRDGPKRVYDRLYRLASKSGKCYASAPWLAEVLGKSARQVRYDLEVLERERLIRHQRHGRNANSQDFLYHPMFEANVQSIARQETGTNMQQVARQTEGPTCNPASANVQDLSPNVQCIAAKPEKLIINPKEPEEKGKAAADDDEQKSPEAEFRRRMQERHGDRLDVLDLQRRLHEVLETSEVGLDEWLRLDAEKTTNARGLTNPVGHYLALAKSLAAKARGRLFNNDRRLSRDIEELARHGGNGQRCSTCSAGRLGEGYCSCKMGRDLERAERRRSGVARAPQAAQKQAAIVAPVLEAGAHEADLGETA